MTWVSEACVLYRRGLAHQYHDAPRSGGVVARVSQKRFFPRCGNVCRRRAERVYKTVPLLVSRGGWQLETMAFPMRIDNQEEVDLFSPPGIGHMT
jgi:hypothetical protein